MDIIDARNRFQEPTLDRGAAAVAGDPAAGVEPVPERPAVSLIQIRRALPDVPALNAVQTVARNNYGPASNEQFFNHVFQVEAIFKQLVVFNSQIGVFAGNINRPVAAKMMQLVSMGRLGSRGLLPNQQTQRSAFYQSLALAEGLGPHVPADWRLARDVARAEIIDAVVWLQTEEGRDLFGLDMDAWFDAEILGVEEGVAVGERRPNIHEAMVLLSNAQWLNSVSYVSTAIGSLCRRGQMTDENRDKILAGVKEATSNTSVAMPIPTIKRFYSMYCTEVTGENAGGIMAHYQALIPENITVLRNAVVQAAGSGLTTYITILRALTTLRF